MTNFSVLARLDRTLTLSSQYIKSISTCEEVVLNIFKRIDYVIKYEKLPSSRAIKHSSSGETDGEVCRVAGLEKKYKTLFMIKPRVMSMYIAVFVNKERFKRKINSLKDLKNLKVAIRRGHFYAEDIVRELDLKKVERIGSTKNILQMVQNARVDAGIMILHNALENIQVSPDKYKNILLAKLDLKEIFLHLYIHKNYKDLEKSINKAAQEALDQGVQKTIIDRYINQYEPLINSLKLESDAT